MSMSMPPPPPSSPPFPAPGPLPVEQPSSGPSNRRWLIIGAAVGGVAALVVAIVLLSGRSDSGDDGIDTAAAREAIDDSLEEAEVPDGGTPANVEGDCPGIDLDDLVDEAPRGVNADEVGDTIFVTLVTTTRTSDPTVLLCTWSGDDGRDGVSVLIGAAPESDFDRYVKRTLPEATVDIEEPLAFRGGQVYEYCAEWDDAELGEFCESDWTDGSIQIGIAAFGSLDNDDMTEWLKAVLDDLIEAAADLEADDLTLAE
jgi:hypothetical protein